jgi:hypothetical protein
MSIVYKLEELKAENVVTAVMFYIGKHVAEEPAAKRGTGASRPTVLYFADQRAGDVVKIPARHRTDEEEDLIASASIRAACFNQQALLDFVPGQAYLLASVMCKLSTYTDQLELVIGSSSCIISLADYSDLQHLSELERSRQLLMRASRGIRKQIIRHLV